MIAESQNVIRYDRTEQARLALALIDSLGVEGAIFACRANGWDGVLAFLGQYPIELNRRGSVRSDEIARYFKGRAALSV